MSPGFNVVGAAWVHAPLARPEHALAPVKKPFNSRLLVLVPAAGIEPATY